MTLLTRGTPRPKKATSPVVKTVSFPAPVRGLNYRDSLAAMRPTDALQLDNLVCRAGAVEIRPGRVTHATGLPDVVESLFVYNASDGTREIYAASGTGFYDVTSAGAVGAAVVGGLSSAYWASAQVNNTAGTFLICVNGVDNGKIYDGAAWTNLGVTGVPITDLINVGVWKRRVWFVERDTLSAWYLATDAIAGPATEFAFSAQFRRGGYLKAILNWTVDGGSGSDDYLVAITSEGEAAIYKGTDPASAATFALVGVYYIGVPVGDRFYSQLGGDILLLTAEGLVPLSRYLQSQTVNKTTFLTDRIQQLISQEVSAYGSVQGWEVRVHLADNVVLLQVPGGEVGSRYQYCMSLITGGWSRLLVSPAVCWMVVGDQLYFGGDTKTYNGWVPGPDDGEPVPYTLFPAFTDFRTPTTQKRLTLSRLTIESDLAPALVTQAMLDYNQAYYPQTPVATAPTGAFWDVALWDSTVWGADTSIYRPWYSLAGLGYVATQVIQGASAGSVLRFIACDYVYEPGGLL